MDYQVLVDIFSGVRVVGDCWERPRQFKRRKAPRQVMTAINGPLSQQLVVMHTCDNSRCVNPNHLRLGTQLENIADMVAKGRHHLKYKLRHARNSGLHCTI